jgi:hypothetical protein
MRRISALVVTLAVVIWASACTTVYVTTVAPPQQAQAAQAGPAPQPGTEQQPAAGASVTVQPQAAVAQPTPAEQAVTVAHKVLFYIPDRVLDAFDIVRLRARVGPGVALGVRATEVVSGFLGAYTSVYAGLPGPRLRPTVKLPIGLESFNGAGVSVASATVSGGIGPDYSPTEFGVSAQVLIVGADVGFDPWELVDFLAGFVMADPRGDDL